MIKDDLEKILGFDVEPTGNLQFGDYTSNVAMQGKRQEVKGKSKNPHELAEEIKSKLDQSDKLAQIIDKVEVAGPGFINFWLKTDVLVDNLTQIDSQKEKYGTSNFGNGKLAIVEYSSPNIAKPFGVGHLRSTVIGDAIANLTKAIGYKVMRDNHLGDWGTQFGKMIYAIKTWGDETEIENSQNPVKELVKLYVKFHEASQEDESLEDSARVWFKKLEDGDSEARRIWQKCIDWSWVEFNKVYELLGVKFDKNFNGGRGLGESYFVTRMKFVIKELEDKNLLKVGEGGAKLVFFDKDKYPPAMILKKDGATLYHTRDLAADRYRLEKYNPDLIINEVGSEQSLYFHQLYEIEKLLGWYKDGSRVHVGHGMYLMDGKKMSTRAGKTVELNEVLQEAIIRAKKLQKDGSVSSDESARQVGIGAIKYFDLLHQPMTNINFDWDNMFALEGNSGPYLQYTVARTNSVLAKLSIANFQFSNKFKINNLKLKIEEETVLRTLIRFPEVVQSAATNYSPNLLCNYLYDLAQKYNSFYAKHKIIADTLAPSEEASDNKYRILVNGEQSTVNSGDTERHSSQITVDSSQSEFRLKLTSATGQVLKNGLKLLGIQTPERM